MSKQSAPILGGAGDELSTFYRAQRFQTEQEALIFMDDALIRKRRGQIFKQYGVNPTIVTSVDPVSTFAMDVDTGSYSLVRTMLSSGQRPPVSAVRVEEFVNAMRYGYKSSGDLFSISAEAIPSPYRPGYHLLHLGVQASKIHADQRRPANLVLVADVSGSMAEENKIELLKLAFTTLVSALRTDDQIAIVSYSNSARVVLRPTLVRNKRKIINRINKLRANGNTNAEAGIELAYRVASQMYQPGLINRVILTSDGLANVGARTPESLLKTIETYRDEGIFLTTTGVGARMYNDWLLEQLADKGNGHYLYFSDQREIRRVFIDNLVTQLQVVAKNAKLRVEFNPQTVSHYRLIGYENRALRDKDFLDAGKDGGEIGAGHRVTALYEVKLIADTTSELGKLKLAYQRPDGIALNGFEKSLPQTIVRHHYADGASDTKLSAAVAAFAEKLRRSYWSGLYDYSTIQTNLNQLQGFYDDASQLNEVLHMLRQAAYLDIELDHRNVVGQDGLNMDHVPLLN